MIYIEDVEPHFDNNTTCSLVRDTFLAIVLVILTLGVRRYYWKDCLWHIRGVFIIGRCYN